MSFPVQLAFRNMESSAAAETLVRERAAELVHFGHRISACRAVLDCVHPKNHLGRLYRVHLDLTLPGGSIVVNRDPARNHMHDDLQLAIRDAFDIARRQLHDRARRKDVTEKRSQAE